jgi:hypothetical protein
MRALVISIAALSINAATPASAEAAPQLREDVARSQGDDALRLFANRRWSEAYALFQRAEGVYHAPTLVLYMAHCKTRLGKLVEARSLYTRVAQEQLDANAAEQFVAAQVVARESLARLDGRIPSLDLSKLQATYPRRQVLVRVDGVDVPGREAKRELDPGDHVVELLVEDEAPSRWTIHLEERARVELTRPPPTLDTPVEPSRGSLLPASIAFGAAGASAAAGAVTGILSLNRIADLRAHCSPDGRCPTEKAATGAAAGRLADASSALFIAAGVATAAGAVLLVLRPRPRGPTPAGLRIGLGVGSASVEGDF